MGSLESNCIRGSGFQPRCFNSRALRGWKPLPRKQLLRTRQRLQALWQDHFEACAAQFL